MNDTLNGLRDGGVAPREAHNLDLGGSSPSPATIASRILDFVHTWTGDELEGDPIIEQIAYIANELGLPDLDYADYHTFQNTAHRAGHCVDVPQAGDVVLLSYQWHEASWCGVVTSVAGSDIIFVAAVPYEARHESNLAEIAYNLREPNPLWRICAFIRL